MEKGEFKFFLSTIQRLKGIDLSSYRENFLLRRLNYRLKLTKSENLFVYLNLIKKDSGEFNRFLDSLAINVSEFFRDPEVFDYFRKNCLKELIRRKESYNSRAIRIWSAGCAYGEEAYSLAILLKEEIDKIDEYFVSIRGTDVDKDALQCAKKAEYMLGSLKEMDKERLAKYFTPLSNNSFKLNEQIRHMVKFSQCDLINDAPLKYMDVIFCRNVMIYFSKEQQDILLSKFYNALSPKGYLVIGKVETIWGNLRNKFIPVSTHQKIFQKK